MIDGIGPIRLPELIAPAGVAAPGVAFAKVLENATGEVGRLGQQATALTENFLNGEPVELHNVVLAQQRAGLAFDLFLQVRNKVVQAYQEVMRMQV